MAKRGGLGRGLDALIPAGESSGGKRIAGEEKEAAEKKSKSGSGKKNSGKAGTKLEKNRKEKKPQADMQDPSTSPDGYVTAQPEIEKRISGAGAIAEDKSINSSDNNITQSNRDINSSEEVEILPFDKTVTQYTEEMSKDGEVILMRLSLVEPNREQPRKYFNDEKIEELADSVRQFGIIQPLLVQKKDDYYEIIAGERRWRAAKKAGLHEIPVIIKNFSSQEAVEVSLIENIQREDLNPIEEAKAYDRLVRDYGMNQEEVASRVSKSRSAVTNSLRLLKLEEELQKLVETSELSEGHARALLGASSGEMQKKLAEQVLKEKLSVRQTEKLVRDTVNPSSHRRKIKDVRAAAMLEELSENLKSVLGTKVTIRQNGKNRGKIEIEYYSDDELDRLYEMLRSI